jgi:hypothetical protein
MRYVSRVTGMEVIVLQSPELKTEGDLFLGLQAG